MRSLIVGSLIALALLLGTTASRAEALPQEVVINGVEFVHVPEGWFWYAVDGGTWKDVSEGRVPYYRDVRIWLDGFYIGKYEARARDLFRFFTSGASQKTDQYVSGEARGCAVRRRSDGEWYLANPERDLPATHLSWELSVEFAEWMGFRLPTEMEWVKAARGTDKRIWPWGDEHPDDTHAGFSLGPACQALPVDYFRNGVSPYGAYNMAGNVLEYVADWYNEDYDVSLKDGMRNPPLATEGTTRGGELSAQMRTLKGGRWGSNAPSIHVYARRRMAPSENFICFGTRFAIDEATVRAHLSRGTATVVMQGRS